MNIYMYVQNYHVRWGKRWDALLSSYQEKEHNKKWKWRGCRFCDALLAFGSDSDDGVCKVQK